MNEPVYINAERLLEYVMNGLKYIRTRCNLSLSELADMIGVSRQALSSWENGRKDIPEKRVNQLMEFFGVDREFLGEISDEKKNELIDKAMFRYDEKGKEYYRFKTQEGLTSLDQTRVSFFFDNSQKSLDEEYILARYKKQEMLNAIENIIEWTKDGEWILNLSEQIKAHWDMEYAYYEKYHQNVQSELKAKEVETQETKSLEEQIADIENDRKELIKKYGELLK